MFRFSRHCLRPLLIAWLSSQAAAVGQPWAPGQGPPPGLTLPSRAEAQQLEELRQTGEPKQLRERYLREAHNLLHRFWASQEQPKLLLAGDRAEGCGVKKVAHPMAYYCPPSRELAMALNLRSSVRSAKGKTDRELLLLDLAVLAHEWGHHVNRELGRGPFQGGLGLTVKQEELAADWRTGVFLGWMLNQGAINVDDFTQTANLMFEMGDYERMAAQHHGYPKDRFQALTRGLSSQLRAGQKLGEWRVDTSETFSRPLRVSAEDRQLGRRRYEVRRFEIDRDQQIATNLIGGLLGAASCVWGNQQQCIGMAAQQGKGRADGRYTARRLTLDCRTGRFDVSDDAFDPQPVARDGKGQAPVLLERDCATAQALRG
ncbi:zinc peptidase [Synechococcus sp. HK05]|uniref:zinc peptidase n=1 Tax=Synechococcus sp. HK05 TaxID=2725975 RepID=UPI0020CB1EEB|nr:zinc peptidase [Synechococcus sp. HK05]